MKHTFGKIVVCHTNDFSASQSDKIETWVKNRGGKVVKELTDDVTHYVVSRRVWHANWQNNHPVRIARRKGTIYIVKFDWLEDSLIGTTGRPLDESNEKYAWEVAHAKRVKEKRKKQKQEESKTRKKEKKKAAAVVEACRTDSNIDDSEDIPNRSLTKDGDILETLGRTTTSNGVRKSKNSTVEGKKKAQKMKDIIQCGIKFDKSCLEFENGMALAGYRPYTNSNNFIYLVMLVREDVFTGIEERYQLKSSTHKDASVPGEGCQSSYRYSTSNACNGISNTTVRPRNLFQVNHDTTILHYLDDVSCCRNFKRPFWDNGVDTINNGRCTPKPDHHRGRTHVGGLHFETTSSDPRPATSHTDPVFDHWPQHLPFSVYPVMRYQPDIQLEYLPQLHPRHRVSIPKPFAYSLQLYESYTPTLPPRPMIIPSISPSTHRPSSGFSQAARITTQPPASVPSQHSASQQSLTPTKKTYTVVAQYTRKGRPQADPIFLTPKGSTWDFAIDAFRKMFAKKTGISWEDALSGAGGRRDSGIGISKQVSSRDKDEDLDEDTQGEGGMNMDVSNDKFRYIPNMSQPFERIWKQYRQYLGEEWLVVPKLESDNQPRDGDPAGTATIDKVVDGGR